ncbi:MAG TPA: uracil-DNA glycosylase family protein [Gaiellaceae bacterium]|nr:uracil-DNA glycosylase family protein [Gaiellaceae bacterium]
MPRRKSSYRSLGSLQRDNAACRACLEAGHPLESLPVFEGRSGQRAMIIGQAPGIVEGEELRPWRGRAGKTLRRWLEVSEDEFYATFYCCSLTRCYPGRSAGGRGDRTPAPAEIELCRLWRDWELRLLRPDLVLVVGGLAARHVLGLPRLTEAVGTSTILEGATAFPLPHPSGASGWLNDRSNRARLERALVTVRKSVAGLGRSTS